MIINVIANHIAILSDNLSEDIIESGRFGEPEKSRDDVGIRVLGTEAVGGIRALLE
jgi:hypothetical protein